MANPRRKKKNTHQTRARSRNPFHAAPHRRRRSNPFRKSQRRRNPNRETIKGFALEGVKAVVAGAASSVGTRAIVQGILGDKNQGAMGYLANLFIAFGGAWGLLKLTGSKAIALGWAVGGSASTVQRIWSEKVSMTSPAAAAPALGDLDYSSNGLGGVGLSGFVNTGFALPSVTDGNGVIQPSFQPQQPAVAAAAGSASGTNVLNIPGGNVARFAPRY
ncbi:MAG: hypothetical protein LAP21_15185 [Acidobacteriia bacterium]|nr:hypothetical protein [Terriglobia bacterium]